MGGNATNGHVGNGSGNGGRAPADGDFFPSAGHSHEAPAPAAHSAAWTLKAIEPAADLAPALVRLAERIELAAQTDAPSMLREALLVIAPWGRSVDQTRWQKKQARISALITLGAEETAVAELLPEGARYMAGATDEGLYTVHITLDEKLGEIIASARSLPVALTSALFRALARYVASH